MTALADQTAPGRVLDRARDALARRGDRSAGPSTTTAAPDPTRDISVRAPLRRSSILLLLLAVTGALGDDPGLVVE